MTGPLDKDHLVVNHIDEYENSNVNEISYENSDMDESSDDDENSDEDTSSAHSSPFLPPKPRHDPALISSCVQAGYISCREWRLSSSVHSSSGMS